MDVTGVTGGNVSDPLTVELRGPEPAMFDVRLSMWTAKPLATDAKVYVQVSRQSYYKPFNPLIMSFACESGDEADAVDLMQPGSHAVVQVIGPTTSPGEVNCVLTFTPERELENALTLQWEVSASFESSPDDGDEVVVSFEVTELADSPRRTPS
jgi:hypothetical protein